MNKIVAAILSKSREDLLNKIKLVSGILETAHIDVMDGKFVPNVTVGVKEILPLPSGINYGFHLMVENPEMYILSLGLPALYIVHVEAMKSFEAVNIAVEKCKGKLGLAINPETPLEVLRPYFDSVDYFLVMSVHPGYSGQKYIPDVENKISALRRIRPDADIAVDGGINENTIKRAKEAGANIFCAASAIYNSDDVSSAIKKLEDALNG